uniref:Uncharacterized protein n=1 Tax=Opuntia streptacantha TaxID=393608 RepID=A0A7C8Z2Q7_OPUST
MEEEGRWADLSNDILALILNRLHTQSDLRRFRSICKSWRSYASSSPDPQPLFPLSLPSLHPNSRPFSLTPTLVYILSLHPNPTPHNPCDNVWLVKVSETGENRWALLNPLTKHKLSFPSGVSWNRTNLLGFGNCEVGRSYKLQLVGDGVEGTFNFEEFSPSIALRKVAVKIGDEFVVLVLYGYGEIALWKLGDKNWKIIEAGKHNGSDNRQDFDDVICFNGKFYAVDRRGRLAVIDPTSFELHEVIPAMEDCNGQYTWWNLISVYTW